LNNQLENIKDKYNEVLMRMTLLGLENNNILEELKTLEQTIKLYKETKK
jgi:DNA-binding NarL/FixJ family response regulator